MNKFVVVMTSAFFFANEASVVFSHTYTIKNETSMEIMVELFLMNADALTSELFREALGRPAPKKERRMLYANSIVKINSGTSCIQQIKASSIVRPEKSFSFTVPVFSNRCKKHTFVISSKNQSNLTITMDP